MTPGLARGPPFPAKAAKGAIVAVASLDRPSVPSVVGICEIDISSLREIQGAKGHAVQVQHWDGDELWAWNQNGKPGGSAPNSIEGWDTNDESDCLKDSVQDLELEEHDEGAGQGGVPIHIGGNVADGNENKRNVFVEGEDGKHSADPEVEKKELSTKGFPPNTIPCVWLADVRIEIDEIFWNAFLYGLHHHRSTNKSSPHHGIDLPVSQSAVISSLVLPFLPDTIPPSQAASLNIKKTSWKNAKKFIKAFDKAKIIRSKDRDGGECVIQDIDFDDRAITEFVPYKILKKENASAESASGEDGKISSTGLSRASHSDDSIGQRLESLNLYKPRSQLAPIFNASNARLDSCLLPHEIRSIVNSYIESENLVSTTNKRLINLDPIIANAVFDNSQPHDDEIVAKGSIPRDILMDRILQICTPHWSLLRNSETRESVKPTPGVFHKVQIVLETRSGNKTVTKVSGVEPFYVHPQPLADELQKACASSTSVNQLAGSSPKKPIMEIMVQGPQKDAVIKALGRRGINKQWIEIVDKTKGKKK